MEVARTSPEVYRRVRASPSESEVREDFGVTGRGSDAKGVGGRETERKGERKGTRDISKSPWDEGKEKGTRRKGEGQGE